jgi:hypothetical protein
MKEDNLKSGWMRVLNIYNHIFFLPIFLLILPLAILDEMSVIKPIRGLIKIYKNL